MKLRGLLVSWAAKDQTLWLGLDHFTSQCFFLKSLSDFIFIWSTNNKCSLFGQKTNKQITLMKLKTPSGSRQDLTKQAFVSLSLERRSWLSATDDMRDEYKLSGAKWSKIKQLTSALQQGKRRRCCDCLLSFFTRPAFVGYPAMQSHFFITETL